MKRLQLLAISLVYSVALLAQIKNNNMDSVLKKVNADRDFFNGLGNIYPADKNVEIKNETLEGVTCYWFMPGNFDENRIIIYLHGGMFGLGSIQSHKPVVSHFASALSAKILFIEYGLAPERPFPNGLNDVLKVYRALTRKYPHAKIAVIGDSAGGGLAATLIYKLTEEKLPVPSGVIMISPWIYLTCNTTSYETRKLMDPIIKKEKLQDYANYYAAGNWKEADPGQLNFKSFPPLLILVGSNEILFDDSKLFYEKIKGLQPNTQMKEYANQTHVWPITDINSDAAKNAITDMKDFVGKTMGR